MTKLKNVAIIGGGAAGLCTARHLLHWNQGCGVKAVVFEQRGVLGGTWVYEDVNKDELNNHLFSSIYANLRTNLPKTVMMFPDFPYADNVPTYMHHTDVCRYLEQYAQRYQLSRHVRFNTQVLNVSPLSDAACDDKERFVRWKVTSTDKTTLKVSEEEFDAVVVCNGHYSVPSYPSIKGLDNFTGELLHSHFYRHPEPYTSKVVLIQGCGPSAVDIVAELSNYCDTVYLSHRGAPVTSRLPNNVVETPNIAFVNEDGGFVMEDGSVVHVDTFLPCTGYKLKFPFFSENSQVMIQDDNVVLNLFKHIFHIKYPSLSFVGLTWKNTPLPAFHQQCQYIAKVITDVVQLPSYEEMKEDTSREMEERSRSGEGGKYFHRMGERQWQYSRDIAKLAGNEENPAVIENLYKFIMKYRSANFCTYKNMEIKINGENEFEAFPFL